MEDFDAIHSDKAKKMLEEYRIGELITTGYASVDSSPNNSIHGPSSNLHLNLALIREFASDEERHSHHTNHIFVCATIDEKLFIRAYTLSSYMDAIGYFELVMKVYFKGVHPKFPKDGLVSQYLNRLELGSSSEIPQWWPSVAASQQARARLIYFDVVNEPSSSLLRCCDTRPPLGNFGWTPLK
ncbi:nitrate reductase 2 [Perilla frutescens var. hirtella]|uniref:Nitrate reductase 2 n=1 Tax=Perilla frutescens var. hirtella TaxID=608512 RepID=A0AAD4IWX5_PERFH|nr:nitrate reductase 2 [Perilla frutescens var. hirtella]